MTRFWPNFKGNVYGINNNHNNNTNTNNKKQKFLSNYWPNFEETLEVGFWDQKQQILKQAGTELCQAQHSLSLDLDTN